MCVCGFAKRLPSANYDTRGVTMRIFPPFQGHAFLRFATNYDSNRSDRGPGLGGPICFFGAAERRARELGYARILGANLLPS